MSIHCIKEIVMIIIIIIIFINCNWVFTRWQWLIYVHTIYKIAANFTSGGPNEKPTQCTNSVIYFAFLPYMFRAYIQPIIKRLRVQCGKR
jgi:hypothetical protein